MAAGAVLTGLVPLSIDDNSPWTPWIGWIVRIGADRGQPRIAWLFAIIPGVVAVINYWVAEYPRVEKAGSAVERWLHQLRNTHGDDLRAARAVARIDAHLQRDSLTSDQPRFAYTLFAAGLLTMVFGIVAQLSDGPWGLGVKETSSYGNRRARVPSPHTPASAGAAEQTEGTQGGGAGPGSDALELLPVPPTTLPGNRDVAPVPTPEPSQPPPAVPEQRGPIKGETQRGVVFAGLGAYVFALQLLIGRVNTGSLSGRFLIRLAAQSAIALLLGATAGQLGIGFAIASERQSLFLYFALGLFPGLARQALQRRGQALLAPGEPACESLPLCLVDGIDEDTVDRLSEMGISDVQHLATVDPVDFMLRAGYSPMRVLDWIDQAMLITYLRRRVALARAYGIRGAIDFSVLYLDHEPAEAPTGQTETAARARVVLSAMSTRLEMSEEVLLSIGRALWEDDNLHFVWLLWMNRVMWESETEADLKQGLTSKSSEEAPIGLHLSTEPVSTPGSDPPLEGSTKK
jgi:hypothetical protein